MTPTSIARTFQNKNIYVFLLIAFVWSYSAWLTGLNFLAQDSSGENMDRFVNCFYLGVYGPAIGALVTALSMGGFEGLGNLLKRFLIWKAPFHIYMFIIFFPIVFLAVGILTFKLFHGDVGEFDVSAIRAIPNLLLASLVAGPLGEELGWRGWLLPNLQKQYSAATSSYIIAPIWFVWHAPLFFAPFGTLISNEPFSIITFIGYLIFVACLACLYTWIYNNSNGSLLMSLLFHLFGNAGVLLMFFPALGSEYKLIYYLSIPFIVATTLFIGYKTRFEDGSRTTSE